MENVTLNAYRWNKQHSLIFDLGEGKVREVVAHMIKKFWSLDAHRK